MSFCGYLLTPDLLEILGSTATRAYSQLVNNIYSRGSKEEVCLLFEVNWIVAEQFCCSCASEFGDWIGTHLPHALLTQKGIKWSAMGIFQPVNANYVCIYTYEL